MSEKLLYEGKAKKIFSTDDADIVRVAYKNDTTAFNGEKFEQLEGKGQLNNEITSFFFNYLAEQGIESHFVRKISDTEQLVKRVEIVPLEVVTRNIAAGSLSKRLGWEEGRKLPEPIVEFYYKDDDLGDPLLADVHIQTLGLATDEELNELRRRALAVNDSLLKLLTPRGLLLLILNSNLDVTLPEIFCWPMKYRRTPVDSGMQKLMKKWTKIVSAVILAE